VAQRIKELHSLLDVASYWRYCIADLGHKPDQRIAYDMVQVVGRDHFDSWYSDGTGNSAFVEAFDLVAELETCLPMAISRPSTPNS
jgi:hypothetical protein